jgi:antitoxin component YwqK of YwqJK toxin-antitoxin module
MKKPLVALFVSLLMVGWKEDSKKPGGDSPESNRTSAETPPAKTAEVGGIDLDDKSSGWVKRVRGDGRIWLLTKYNKDGKKDGPSTWWYNNGQKRHEETYKDGRLITAIVWRPNGEKCPDTNVVKGNGVWVLYNEDGTEFVRHTYKDGEEAKANQSSADPPDAKPAQVGKIDLNDPKTRKKIVAKAVKGKKLQFRGKTGEELAYAPNQQKPYTGWKKWIHDNGRLVGLSQFKNGKLDGLRTWWYPNGRKKAERTYKDGKLWTAVRWKPNGEKCPVTNLKDGNGVVVQLHPKGPVHLPTTFKDGKIVRD